MLIQTPVPKSKGKKKFRNAEEAAKHRELEASWKKLKEKYATKKVSASAPRPPSINSVLDFQASLGRLPLPAGSRPDPVPEAKAFSVDPTHYTGTEVLGVVNLHKSNFTTVMRDNPEAAVEAAKMRR